MESEFLAYDAREIASTEQVKVDLIITSPPYIAAQKYTRSTSLEMYWLGLLRTASERSALERRVIGSEGGYLMRGQKCPETGIDAVDSIVRWVWGRDRRRAKIVADYFGAMETVLDRLSIALRPGGHLVLVIGNNSVCGKRIPVATLLRALAERTGKLVCDLVLTDQIRSYGLMTKRHATAGIITREYVLVLRKR